MCYLNFLNTVSNSIINLFVWEFHGIKYSSRNRSHECQKLLSSTGVLGAWFLCSRAHFISHCWFLVWFHASELVLCLAAAMFSKLFFLHKHTICGMFTVRVKNIEIGKDQKDIMLLYDRKKVWRENDMQIKAKII